MEDQYAAEHKGYRDLFMTRKQEIAGIRKALSDTARDLRTMREMLDTERMRCVTWSMPMHATSKCVANNNQAGNVRWKSN